MATFDLLVVGLFVVGALVSLYLGGRIKIIRLIGLLEVVFEYPNVEPQEKLPK